jgi:hypothetical protein
VSGKERQASRKRELPSHSAACATHALLTAGLPRLLLLQDLQAVEDAKKQLELRKNLKLPDAFLRVVQINPARPR